MCSKTADISKLLCLFIVSVQPPSKGHSRESQKKVSHARRINLHNPRHPLSYSRIILLESMHTKSTLAVSLVCLVALTTFYISRTEDSPKSTNTSTTGISADLLSEENNAAPPVKPVPARHFYVEDLENSDNCFGCTKGQNAEKQLSVDDKLATWELDDTIYLTEHFLKFTNGTKLIQRSITSNLFKRLDFEDQKRLVSYATTAESHDFAPIPHLCWYPGTDKSLTEAFSLVRSQALSEINSDGQQPVFQGNDRWSVTATDGSSNPNTSAVTLTWSFLPDGTTISQDIDSPSSSNLIARLNAAYGASTSGNIQDAPWFELFERAFSEWSNITGNIYIYEPNDDGASFPISPGSRNLRGDIRIGGTRIDGDNNILAFNYFPNIGDMVIDTDDVNNFRDTVTGRNFFINVLAHEHGHGLGLSHVCPVNQTKLMEPFASSSFVGAQFDELITIQGLYGDPLERHGDLRNNDSTVNAYDLSSLNGIRTLADLSISNNDDSDVFKFRVENGSRLKVELIPTSVTAYAEGSQNNDGSCSVGTLFDPRNRQDLSFRVLASDGSSVIAESSTSPIGQAEVIDNILLGNVDQDYFIEINGGDENSGDSNNAQVYSLVLTQTNTQTLSASNFTIISESCQPNNSQIDPNEAIQARFTITNTGDGRIESPTVSLNSAPNLSIIGDATRSLASMEVNQSTTVTFNFRVAGECGSEASIELALDTGAGISTHTERFDLGEVNSILNINFEQDPGLPSELTQFSGNPLAQWRVTSSNAIEGSRSVQSTGVDEANAALLTTSSFTPTANIRELTFDHAYDFEDQYDGGILEIQIGQGFWVEWTAAGGTFTNGGYDDTILSTSGSPLVGRMAWTGNSTTTVVSTTAVFPDIAIGKEVKVRWHFASDFTIASDFWRIDNIQLRGFTCCISIPEISITASDPSAKEFDIADTGQFTVNSDFAPTSDLNVPYTVSGSATSGSDFVALAGVSTISAGSLSTPITVTAIRDNTVEGDETISLTLTPGTGYTIGSSSATVTVLDLPIDNWRHNNLPRATENIADLDDFDQDGLLNLIEYAFGLTPTQSSTLPIETKLDSTGTKLELIFTENTTLEDIQYIVESSTSLASGSWSTNGITRTDGSTNAEGIRQVTASVDVSDTRRFLRLRIVRLSSQ